MTARAFGRLLRGPSFPAALVCAASLAGYACGGPKAARDAHGAKNPTAEGARAGSACVDRLPLETCVDYAIEREGVVELLGDLEEARDQRSIAVAEAALASNDPVVTEAGLRLLGPFAGSHEQAAAMAAPLVMSREVMSHHLAAKVAGGSSKYAALGRQYDRGHPDVVDANPWAEPPPLDYAKTGFKGPYPRATPYAPGDSEMSVGFATADAVDAVVAHYRGELGQAPKPLNDLDQLIVQGAQRDTQKLIEQMQELQLEYQRTQDPKVFEKMQALGKSQAEGGLDALAKAPLPEGVTRTTATAFIAEQGAAGPERVAVVYREPLVDRTIVILIWLAPKYPPQRRGAPSLRQLPL